MVIGYLENSIQGTWRNGLGKFISLIVVNGLFPSLVSLDYI